MTLFTFFCCNESFDDATFCVGAAFFSLLFAAGAVDDVPVSVVGAVPVAVGDAGCCVNNSFRFSALNGLGPVEVSGLNGSKFTASG